MPLDFCYALLKHAEINSREYAFLKNAVIKHNPITTVVIISEADRINKFITWAQQFYPDAADRIKVTTDSQHQEKCLHLRESQ